MNSSYSSSLYGSQEPPRPFHHIHISQYYHASPRNRLQEHRDATSTRPCVSSLFKVRKCQYSPKTQKSHGRYLHRKRERRRVGANHEQGLLLVHIQPHSLRSVVRNLLSTGPPGITPAFTNAARSRLRQTNTKALPAPYSLFRKQTRDSPATPLPHLHDALSRARSLYGAGMGFSSLVVLASIVRATIGLRWEDDGDMSDILAIIDADIGQAIQVSFVTPNDIHDPTLSDHFAEFQRRN